MALDWSTAEPYTSALYKTPDSRFSALPLDIVGTLAPYLHTHVTNGIPFYDGRSHGTYIWRNPGYFGSLKCRDGHSHGYELIWNSDGSLCQYYEHDNSHIVLSIVWSGYKVYVAYGYKRNTQHDTLPPEYLYVWERMTRVVDI